MTETAYIADAVRQSRRTRRTVYRWIEEGLLPPPVKIRGRLAWRRDELDAALVALLKPEASSKRLA